MFRYAQAAILAAAGMIGSGGGFAIAAEPEPLVLPSIKSSGAYGGGKRDLRIRTSKYMPHQGAREKARRRRQMDDSQLRFHAFG